VKLRRAAPALLVAVGSTAAPAVLPAAAGAQLPGEPPPPPPAPQGAQLQIDVEGVKHDRVTVGDKVKVVGTLKPFVEGQKVQVVVSRADHTLKDQVVEVKQAKNGDGEFQLRSPRLIQPGDYKARAVFEGTPELGGASAESNSFSIRYPALKKGNGGHDVAVFNKLLAKQGYATSHGSKYTQTTAWAVLAFRKVHGMSRIQSATSGIFRTLAEGKGAYEVQHPGAGRHAEVSLSKQVLVLAEGDKPQLTYHISSGTIATPSDQGGYRFYRKDAGYNSLGMYYSAYYNRGEATHGYHSVPTHPASHGCIRIPIPQARQVYNWIQIGMPMFVY
jgi:lipoprotein-anchoring transpeptidase ErfK/SrfK